MSKDSSPDSVIALPNKAVFLTFKPSEIGELYDHIASHETDHGRRYLGQGNAEIDNHLNTSATWRDSRQVQVHGIWPVQNLMN
jgi:hypothetical protein